MSCDINSTFAERLSNMTDKQVIEYAESFLGVEGRELARELAKRVRAKNAEIYHLEGRLNSTVERHTS